MKKLLSFILLASLIFSLTACGKPNDESKPSNANEAVTTEGVETTENVTTEDVAEDTEETSDAPSDDQSALVTTYPLEITDQAGRTVTIEKEPETIVSAYYISTSALIALGLEDKLIGIEAKAGSRPIYSLSAPALLDLPNVGSAKEFDLEGLVALNPDIAILPKKLMDAAETLSELGITVILVNPESQDELLDMISLVSDVTNTKALGDELITFTKEQLDMLSSKLPSTAPMVYMGGNASILTTASSGMYQSQLIAQSGGVNVAQDIDDTYWVDVSYEQILAWNPEYIILPSDAEYSVDDVKNDSALAECDAVKSGNVYQMPNTVEAWDSPVPSSILGSIWLASVLHSDVVSEDELNQISNNYYDKFYGISYN